MASLGLTNQLVGISHECDYPSSVRGVPVMVHPIIGHEPSSSREIDRQVKQSVAAGQPLYRLDEEAFSHARPDIILTQDLCHVCAVTPDQLSRAIQTLTPPPTIVTLGPTSLEQVLIDVERIADALGHTARGRRLVHSLRERMNRVHTRVTGTTRPRVVCLEWLDPLYVAGHWVPDMVEWAGGLDVLGSKNGPSRETTWRDVMTARPDVLIFMPCGYTVSQIISELARSGTTQSRLGWAGTKGPAMYAVDAVSLFSRPGPRLVDGVEILADIFHPDSRRPLDHACAVKVDEGALAGEIPT